MERKLVPGNLRPVDIIIPATKTAIVATVADHIDRHPSSALLADDIYNSLEVAVAVTLAPHVCTPVLLKAIGSTRRAIEPISNSANRAFLHVAKGVADVTLKKPFNILLTKV